MDLEEHQERTREKLVQSTFGLWNALLTVNGITLSVFSALYAVKPEAGGSSLVLGLIAACVASNCLLIFNHLAMKQTHYRMGEVVEVPPTTPAERERDIKHALWRHNAVFAAEKAALLLFVLESILIAGYVWTLPR